MLRIIGVIVFYVLFTTITVGQYSINESYRWKSKLLRNDDLFYFTLDITDFICSDTTINDISYYKLCREGSLVTGYSLTDTLFELEINEYKGAIRQDVQKWFWVEKNSSIEELLYDFQLMESDSVFIDDFGYLPITKVDSVWIDQNYHNRYQLDGTPIELIEGVGWNTGLLLSPGRVLNFYELAYLQCFHHDGFDFELDLNTFEVTYDIILEPTISCAGAITSVGELTDPNNVVVYPNPCNDILKLSGCDSSAAISIFDTNGMLRTQTLLENGIVQVDFLDSGIYFISLVANNKRVVKKFVKL